jgi:hypothetical protein
LVEQLTLNQRVAGSSPARLTIISNDLRQVKGPAVFHVISTKHVSLITSGSSYSWDICCEIVPFFEVAEACHTVENNYSPRAFSHIFPFGGLLMVGLMQIMIYMLSVYLIFKGVEILQIALMSGRANRTVGVIIGILVLSTAVVAAGGFSLWADQVAASIGERMNTLPSLQR